MKKEKLQEQVKDFEENCFTKENVEKELQKMMEKQVFEIIKKKKIVLNNECFIIKRIYKNKIVFSIFKKWWFGLWKTDDITVSMRIAGLDKEQLSKIQNGEIDGDEIIEKDGKQVDFIIKE